MGQINSIVANARDSGYLGKGHSGKKLLEYLRNNYDSLYYTAMGTMDIMSIESNVLLASTIVNVKPDSEIIGDYQDSKDRVNHVCEKIDQFINVTEQLVTKCQGKMKK